MKLAVITRILLILTAMCLGPITSATAAEQIHSFASEIEVMPDGALVVKETIRVHGEGNQIKRGIYRDFPTRYSGIYGRVLVPFRVLGVMRDGKDEPYHLENRANGVRVYIGRSNAVLPPGDYEYVLAYGTGWQLGFFADHDELYWNVTGNEWAFPIAEAKATVRLPRAVAQNDLRLEAYTGYSGDQGNDYESGVNELGDAEFRTTTRLGPGQGFTIVVGWPKGIVPEPDFRQRLERWSRDNAEWKSGAPCLAVLLAYYLFVWMLYGRDPAGDTVIPRYAPPRDVSPADARYLTRMGFDDRVFGAALISLAVKKYLRIIEDDRHGFSLTADDPGTAREELTNDEQALLKALKLQAGKFKLDTTNHAVVRSARSALETELRKEHFKRNFVTNGVYTIPGLVITAAALVYVSIALPSGSAGSLFMILWLTGWTFGVYMLLAMAFGAWRLVFARNYLMAIPAVFITAFSMPFLGGEVFGLYTLYREGSPLLVVLLLIFAGINYAFYHWLKAPTRAGRAIYDALAGFRMYLTVAEKDRLNLLNAPRRTRELFEKYLPYALALGVENEWSEQFADILQHAGQGDSGAYRPGWYSGPSWTAAAPAAFAGGLASSMAAASSPPGSRSGSSSGGGGGGSSGGGGGGGGGGGW